MSLATNSPVLVTGVTGYIGASLVDELLKKGYKVRGTVRSKEKAKHLPFVDKIELFEADLLKEGSFDEAVAGCEYVFHTASPTGINNVKDPQKDMIDPALKGTKNVLESCDKNKSLKRLILTSSVAAAKGLPKQGQTVTDQHWNTESTIERDPYGLSKVLAEKFAWEFVKGKSFDMVTILPVMVIGTSVNGDPSDSTLPIQKILGGQFSALPAISFHFVHIKDVCQAHILAMENPKASGRYICQTESRTAKQVSDLLVKKYPNYPVTTMDLSGTLGTWLVYGMAYFEDKGVKEYLHSNLGVVYSYDTSKLKELGMTKLIDVDEAIIETAEDLIKIGRVKKVN